jgi:two-component system response regulator YesN
MYSMLLVDDEPLIRKGITEKMDLSSFEIDNVYEAPDGETALRVFREKKPDIVLTDINMPHIDGLTLAKTIKEESRSTRVVMITGYDYFDYALNALKAGVDDFLLKPVSINDIRTLLTRLTSSIKEERKRDESLRTLDDLLISDESPNLYKSAIQKVLNSELSSSGFSLVELAHAINLTPAYVSSLFRQLYGIPFQDWVIQARIDRAKILLLSTSLKIYEVAEKTGFEDPNYFSTAFKKQVGLTPNQYRDATGGGQ